MILTPNKIEYTLRRIAEIAFPSLVCHCKASPEPQILLQNELHIQFSLPTDENVQSLLDGTACYSTVNSYDDKVGVKAFFLSPGVNLFTCEGNKIKVNADILSVSFVMLSRLEELNVDARDKYGRFEYANSISCRYDIIDIPIVDEYALLLRKSVQEHFPKLKIQPREFRMIPTHDIDFLVRFRSFGQSMKTIGGDLLVRKSIRTMFRSLSLYFKSRRDCRYDPYVDSFLNLVKVSKEKNLDSCFYFKTLQKGDKDYTYDIFSKVAKFCIGQAKANNVRIGLHGSFNSYDDEAEMLYEKHNLESACNSEIECGRQHFLRFDASKTPDLWCKSGIANDSTLGFAEHEGFRCGTCHPYPLYDLKNDKEMNVVESPLIAMDTTLTQYRHLSEEEVLASMCRLRERCKAVEGNFVFLWHNTTSRETLEKFLAL